MIRHTLICLALFGALLSTPVFAGVCSVPGTHSTIQAAIDDVGCSDIQLTNQSYFELLQIDRSLTLSGVQDGSAQVIGQVSLIGGTTVASLNDFRIESGCPGGALHVSGGAQVSVSDMEVAWASGTPCLADVVFSGGFED